MTREMNDNWQAKQWHDAMERELAYAAHKGEEWDCNLCAEAPNGCPYCEGYKPELNPDIAEFVNELNERLENK